MTHSFPTRRAADLAVEAERVRQLGRSLGRRKLGRPGTVDPGAGPRNHRRQLPGGRAHEGHPMKITGITVENREIPLDPPFPAAWDSRPRERFAATIVRVETDQGLVGVGSGDPMPGFAGHEHLFLGRDPLALDRHFRVIENLSFHYGRCWPLDLALWDIAAQAAGLPLWKLLGGRSPRLRLYARSEEHTSELQS